VSFHPPNPLSAAAPPSRACPRVDLADRHRPIRSLTVALALRALALAAAVLLWPQPMPALAQAATDPTPGPAAWWARINTVDAATACAAEAAWVHARDVEGRSEFDLSTAPLAPVLTGPELSRQTQTVAALEEQGHGIDQVGVERWRTMGGSQDDVVVYAGYTTRSRQWDPSTAQVTADQWVDTGQAAYRLVRQDGVWRVADRFVFDNSRRPIDAAAFDAVSAAYRQLLAQLVDAYDDRDLDGLAAVLVGEPLDAYQHRVQALLDAGKVEHLRTDGGIGVIDADHDSALVYFHGTFTTVEVDPATGQEHEPLPADNGVFLERLVLDDGHWKIAEDVLPSVQHADDGTISIAGCDGTAG
jgi:hypothetical protein